jgi:inner membrane protein
VDTLIHVVFGACIGEAIAGKRLGKKALFLGTAAQSFPDINFVASFWLSPSQNILAHRDITHSFVFAIVATWLLAHFTK